MISLISTTTCITALTSVSVAREINYCLPSDQEYPTPTCCPKLKLFFTRYGLVSAYLVFVRTSLGKEVVVAECVNNTFTGSLTVDHYHYSGREKQEH